MAENWNHDVDDYDDNEAWEGPKHCTFCGGEGYVECNDPIQCTRAHDQWGDHDCPSCGGSGLAKDMTLW